MEKARSEKENDRGREGMIEGERSRGRGGREGKGRGGRRVNGTLSRSLTQFCNSCRTVEWTYRLLLH